jgi:hypothetical protein
MAVLLRFIEKAFGCANLKHIQVSFGNYNKYFSNASNREGFKLPLGR